MQEDVPNKIERGAKRGLAAVLGLGLGLLLGFIVGLVVFGFGDPLLITTGAIAVLLSALSFKWPAPILFLGEFLLGIVGIDI